MWLAALTVQIELLYPRYANWNRFDLVLAHRYGLAVIEKETVN